MDNNIEIPGTISRHLYDIDVFEIHDNLTKKYAEHGNQKLAKKLNYYTFITDDEDWFVRTVKKEGLDLSAEQKLRHYILPSKSNFYQYYLGWKLLTIDPYRIGGVLAFQATLFEGNQYAAKDNFVGLVEFMVYNFVKRRNFLKEEVRLERIMNWLDINRRFVIVTPESKLPMSQQMEVEIPITTAKLVFSEFSKYFNSDQENSLRELLFNNIKPTEKLCFKIGPTLLIELFKRIHYNQLLISTTKTALADWIFDCFCVFEDKEPHHLSKNTITGILSKPDKEPKKDHILTTLVPLLDYSLRSTTKSD